MNFTMLAPPVPGAIPFADISSNNETDDRRIDWPTFAAWWLNLHPQAGVIVKLSQGDWYLNPFRRRQRLGAHAAGIVNVGLYHYVEMVSTGGKFAGRNVTGAQNADFFLQAVGEDGGIQPNEFLASDWESNERISATADLLAAVLDFQGRAQRALGIAPLFYSGDWYAIPHNIEDDAKLADVPKWWAAYGSSIPRRPVNISMWQFTDSAIAPGMPFSVDVSWWLPGLPALRAIQWGHQADPLGGGTVDVPLDVDVPANSESLDDLRLVAGAMARHVAVLQNASSGGNYSHELALLRAEVDWGIRNQWNH